MPAAQIISWSIGGVVLIVLFLLAMGLRRRGASKTSLDLLSGKLKHEQGIEPAAISITDAESTSGGVNVTANTGGGVELSRIKAKKDIVATNNPSPPRPKA